MQLRAAVPGTGEAKKAAAAAAAAAVPLGGVRAGVRRGSVTHAALAAASAAAAAGKRRPLNELLRKMRAGVHTLHPGQSLSALFAIVEGGSGHGGAPSVRELSEHVALLLPGVLSIADERLLLTSFDADGAGTADVLGFQHLVAGGGGGGAPGNDGAGQVPAPPPQPEPTRPRRRRKARAHEPRRQPPAKAVFGHARSISSGWAQVQQREEHEHAAFWRHIDQKLRSSVQTRQNRVGKAEREQMRRNMANAKK